jgi:hypothetical protein
MEDNHSMTGGDDWNEPHPPNHAYASHPQHPVSLYQQVTTKIPPAFDGRSSCFAYEEAIDDWVDITELEPEKRGPALRNRLEGEAAVYKSLLDRDALRNAREGVKYFKGHLRPHFIKGNQSVFLWRFFQLFKAHRGSQDLLRWIGRFSVLRKRIGEAWMDLLQPITDTHDADLYRLSSTSYGSKWSESRSRSTHHYQPRRDRHLHGPI